MSATSIDAIASRIYSIRSSRMMLDHDLAELYGVKTKRLNQQVRRNRQRFPADFVFEPTNEELANLRLHFPTSSWGGRRTRTLAFTQHGAIQVAAVLNTPVAVEISVYIVRAFVALRDMLSSTRELARQLHELETRLTQRLDGHDEEIGRIIQTIRELTSGRPIGFTAKIE